jgi:tetratricopeptide (TPR) repeat protein
METEIHSLLTDGIAAAGAGDTEEAQRLLRRATELEPENAEAWLWRARVTENTADKKAFLEETLRINPNNLDALAAMERISKKEGSVTARVSPEEVFYCTVHPDRETLLRCNRCGRPMCTDCAVQHPVGLRCRECVNQTKAPAYQVDNATFIRALLAATAVGTAVAFLVLLFGNAIWFFFWFFIGGAIGRGIAEAVSRLVPRKRGRLIQIATGIGIVAGLVIAAAILGQGGPLTIRFLFQLPVLLYLGTALTAAVASLR